jgi:hypothetical protein
MRRCLRSVLLLDVSLYDVQIVPSRRPCIAAAIWDSFNHDRQLQLCRGRRCLCWGSGCSQAVPSTGRSCSSPNGFLHSRR